MINEVSVLVAIILGALSIVGLLYRFLIRDAKVDSMMSQLEKYSIPEMALQVKTLWQISVVEALHNRSDLATHQSPLKITEKGESLIPEDIKQLLLNHKITIKKSCKETNSGSWIVITCLGMDRILQLSKDLSLSLTITLALLTVFYIKYHPECKIEDPGNCTDEVFKNFTKDLIS